MAKVPRSGILGALLNSAADTKQKLNTRESLVFTRAVFC